MPSNIRASYLWDSTLVPNCPGIPFISTLLRSALIGVHRAVRNLIDCARGLSPEFSSPIHEHRNSAKTMRKILGAICVFVVCGLLTVGLWPFNFFPENQVSWLRNANGLQFGERARVYSSGMFKLPKPKEDSFCGLELWLQPEVGYLKHSATFLVFSAPDNPNQFRLRQDLDVLQLRRDSRDTQNHLQTISIGIEHFFLQDERVFLTIITSPGGTSVYRNGAFLNIYPGFGLSCKDFSGQLVFGGSLIVSRSWPGKLLGLAIYQQQLTPEQVSRHFAMWTQKVSSEGFRSERLLALYSFSERTGRIVHNSIASTPALYIPRIFRIPRKKILALPWEEFSPDLHYVLQIFVNVAGFVPFGFFFFAYLTSDRRWNRAAIMTILLGGTISLTIEILQGFLISRDSGVTDIITNTLGSGFGVMLWRWRPVQLLATKLFHGQQELIPGKFSKGRSQEKTPLQRLEFSCFAAHSFEQDLF